MIIRNIGDPQSAVTLAKRQCHGAKNCRVYAATRNDEKMVAMKRPIQTNKRTIIATEALPFEGSTYISDRISD